MHCRIFIIVLLSLFICSSRLVAKDKQVRCGGTYPYVYSGSISYDEAKARAVEEAIIKAIADKFGTTVSSASLLEMTNEGERFDQVSRLLTRGRFIRHATQPKVSNPVFADNLFTIQVTVDFYAVPIEYAPAEFSAKMLRNGTDDKFESDCFVADDKFYISFQTPKAGYVAVYFEDKNMVSCLLPYYDDDSEPFHAEKDKRYVFFCNVENNTYHVSCGEEPEINYLHVVFSPHPFIHGDILREAAPRKFRDWLARHQAYDEQMQVQSMIMKVMPKKE